MSAPSDQRRAARVRAPELSGRGWLNTGGQLLRLADLRGRFVILDFWTFCCVNCLHVLEELRDTERRRSGELVVIGVHSPKFAHEADPEALAAAVQRYAVEHPVLDDPELLTWSAYTARAWPTLVLIDPEGYVVAQYAGEGHAHAIERMIDDLTPRYRASGALQPGNDPYVAPVAEPGTLRFPAKAISLPDGTVLVADAGSHRLVQLAADAIGDDHAEAIRVIGSGRRGRTDGRPAEAEFAEPNGLCLLPPAVAELAGYDAVVADSASHLLRGVRLADGTVRTLAGDGRQWMQGDGTTSLSTPWDVAWFAERVWIAMAGIHQLWTFDPASGTVEVAAGTTTEGLEDGPAESAWFAQPSGLAVSADGRSLFVADAETSSVRRVTAGNEGSLQVSTLVGQGLFDFGLVDGPAPQALLQHPLGVTTLPDGSLAVHDTYNGAVRRLHFDPSTVPPAPEPEAPDDYGDVVAPETDPRQGWEVSTLATGLAEPSGGFVSGDTLVVVESAGHRLTRVPLGAAVVPEQSAQHASRPAITLSTDGIELSVVFTPPPGQKLDDSLGPSTQVMVDSSPPGLLLHGAGTSTELVRELTFSDDFTDGVLHVSARAASCDIEAEHGTCHIHQQDWGVPVRLVEGAGESLQLVLAG
jgi:thiol-disulfide isomerase/thioredoxin